MQLPMLTSGATAPTLPAFKQLTLVGANGAGKTRFMNYLIEQSADRAFSLSALDAFYPQRNPSALPQSIDAQYNAALLRTPYLKPDAVSEFDKLIFLLLNDECTYLLAHKSQQLFGENPGPLLPTRLDRLIALWQDIFPHNQILRYNGALAFSTPGGDDVVSALRLSKGEKAALYYIAAVLYAPHGADIYIDSPSLFIHPALLNHFWNAIESLRPDCRFIYCTYDVSFLSTRTEGVAIWVRAFNAADNSWDYQILAPGQLSEELSIQLSGARRPVLFIEGDATHSLDAKLYTLIFSEYSVRPLGSCDKVIESTRAFADLQSLHHLSNLGIVDRDRRTEHEVAYLRRKNILVPEVAEIENLFLLPDVIKIMAQRRHRNPEKIFFRIKDAVMKMFKANLEVQVLQHVRHRVKRLAQCRIDGRFRNIAELRNHIRALPQILNPEKEYHDLCTQFLQYISDADYNAVLRVFNHKPMLSSCELHTMLGYSSLDAYITDILATLKGRDTQGKMLEKAFRVALLAPDPA